MTEGFEKISRIQDEILGEVWQAAGEATANQMATQMVIDPALNTILGDNPGDLDTVSKAFGLTNLSNKTAVSIFSLAE